MSMAAATAPLPIAFASRKTSYKLPPTTITDKLVSQEARRSKALEEQKRRRAQRVDSSRQLDRFAEMTLGMSDDDEAAGEEEDVQVAPGSVAQYASMLTQEVDPRAIANHFVAPVPSSSSSSLQHPPPQLEEREITKLEFPETLSSNLTTKKKKKKRKKGKRQNKWADRCMYAELLEMASPAHEWDDVDGLPLDLETGWVAVGPVPVGKRCLAITQTSVGTSMTSNTTLRSRLLGKVLLHRFPSSLPPLTVLDCILDANWRENGILHVLDVIKWKGQDVADCESAFRFWWRDTRLAELTHTTAPPPPPPRGQEAHESYRFPYPTRLVPVPYHTDTSLPSLLTHIVPTVRAPQLIPISIPLPTHTFGVGEGMDVEFEFGRPTETQGQAQVKSDGLLLYVKEASYEPGTSPLSSWIPVRSYAEDGENGGQAMEMEGNLTLFEILVQRRLEQARRREGDMDMEG